MADVRPFRGLRYSPAVVADLNTVVTPPYDVISPEAQEQYAARDPLNIIRLELGRDEPHDDALDNRYTRAAATFAQWRIDGALLLEPQPVFYVYQQRFRKQGKNSTRTSLLARVRLEPWEAGVVLPHERTLDKPKDDRLKLLRATAANLSPIMALFDDPGHAVSARLAAVTATAPTASFTDDQGEEHLLWLLTDPQEIAAISATLAPNPLYIADGHHRYETALAYREEIRELHRGIADDDAVNFVLMALVATDDPGLVVLPTHRVLHDLPPERVAGLATALGDVWQLEEYDVTDDAGALLTRIADAGSGDAVAVAIITGDRAWIARLTLVGWQRMAAIDAPEAWRSLDVAVAQELIIDAALGISRDAVATGDRISYTRDANQAIADVRSGTAQVALLLNATRPEQVRDVAIAGGRMPQKSTFFYPKLITGLVINPTW